MCATMAFQSNSNNAWIFNGNNGNLNNGNNRINTNYARVFRDSYIRNCERFEDAVVALSELYFFYFDNRKNKRRSVSQLLFEQNYQQNLRDMWSAINRSEYQLKPGIGFILHWPQTREVIAPDYFDRTPQCYFCETIRPGIEKRLDPNSYSCRVGYGSIKAVQQLAQYVRLESEFGKRPCVFRKTDQKSFFLHIHRPTLVDELNAVICEDFADDARKDVLLYLCRILYTSDTISHVVRQCPAAEWSALPKHKSRFNLSPDEGVDIGNLTAQLGGNFTSRKYLRVFRDYGFDLFVHYTDDVVSVMRTEKSRQFSEIFLPHLRQAEAEMRLELNEKKHYCQDIHKGVSLFGFFMKMTTDGTVLILPSKRVVHNLHNKLRVYMLRGTGNKLYRLHNKERFRDCLNSYFGIFKHCNAYRLRRKLARFVMASDWSDIIEAKPDFRHFGIRRNYTKKAYLIHRNKQFKHLILHYYDTAENQCA